MHTTQDCESARLYGSLLLLRLSETRKLTFPRSRGTLTKDRRKVIVIPPPWIVDSSSESGTAKEIYAHHLHWLDHSPSFEEMVTLHSFHLKYNSDINTKPFIIVCEREAQSMYGSRAVSLGTRACFDAAITIAGVAKKDGISAQVQKSCVKL